MSRTDGYSGIIYLIDPVDKKIKEYCLDVLKELNFLAYNYDTEDHVAPETIREDFFLYPSYSFRYNNDDFNLSCEEGDDYIIFSIDDGEDSKIIEVFTDTLISKLKNIKFAQIDEDGFFPDIDKYVESTNIKYIFKINYFGEAFVKKMGENFFENIPSVQIDRIGSTFKVSMTDSIVKPKLPEVYTEVTTYMKSNGITTSELKKDNRFG